jgi:hypothetical protein
MIVLGFLSLFLSFLFILFFFSPSTSSSGGSSNSSRSDVLRYVIRAQECFPDEKNASRWDAPNMFVEEAPSSSYGQKKTQEKCE